MVKISLTSLEKGNVGTKPTCTINYNNLIIEFKSVHLTIDKIHIKWYHYLMEWYVWEKNDLFHCMTLECENIDKKQSDSTRE